MTSDTKPKVFCKDCKNRYDAPRSSYIVVVPASLCKVATVKTTIHPIHGRIQTYEASDPLVLNKNMDCPHFTPFGAERIRPGNNETPRTPPAIYVGTSLIAFGACTVFAGWGLRMLAIIMVGCVALLVGALFLWLGDS